MPVWRSKESDGVTPTKRRRRVDIVVYRGEQLIAMVETESDLNDLRKEGVTRRNGHYDVASIARGDDGAYFNSYKSLERLAAAAFYWHVQHVSGNYPSPDQAVAMLDQISSDDPGIHNPGSVPLFLVSGFCRQQDPVILDRRLKSLAAVLICANAV